MAFTPFPPRQPTASARLPLTLMTLDDWALATITGADSEKYMQGQVTADVSQMAEDQHLLAAHCDAKGKMWSNLRLFRDGDGFAWIERRSVREPQLTELKKYAVFSKVTIAPDDERVLLGVAAVISANCDQRWTFSVLTFAPKVCPPITAITQQLLLGMQGSCSSGAFNGIPREPSASMRITSHSGRCTSASIASGVNPCTFPWFAFQL